MHPAVEGAVKKSKKTIQNRSPNAPSAAAWKEACPGGTEFCKSYCATQAQISQRSPLRLQDLDGFGISSFSSQDIQTFEAG